jgi:hypothetical protein
MSFKHMSNSRVSRFHTSVPICIIHPHICTYVTQNLTWIPSQENAELWLRRLWWDFVHNSASNPIIDFVTILLIEWTPTDGARQLETATVLTNMKLWCQKCVSWASHLCCKNAQREGWVIKLFLNSILQTLNLQSTAVTFMSLWASV